MTLISSPLPINEAEPCGPSLEYDHEFAVLLARLVPRAEAQYGSFVGAPEALNWAEIERDCQRLLQRTKDINLLVWLCRARTRLAHSSGLVPALESLAAVLDAWPEAVHPQLVVEGEREPALRANALAALADPEGLLGDIFEIAVSTGTALRLTVRDVERALAIPRQADALNPESVRRQLAALHHEALSSPTAPVQCLAQAAAHLRGIDRWAKQQLGDDAPSLQGLIRVLDLFLPVADSALAGATGEHFARHAHDPLHQVAVMVPVRSGLQTRADVLSTINAAREWFELHEPSSPVAVLLKQAACLVGKRFSEVAHSIPLDLLAKWDAPNDNEVTS